MITNWNLPQTVQVLARADTDTDSGTANLNFTSSGIPTLSVPLTEVDSGSSTESDFYLSG